MKATVEIVKIGPKQAEQLLQSQVKEQRHLRDSHVNTLAKDMTNGDFRLSADALVVIKGALANGQHRMWAVTESGTTQPFLLMTTDDEELYKVLDCGLKRTVGDAAHITNASGITAIAKVVMAYQRGALTQYSINSSKKCSRIETIEFIQKHNEDLQVGYSVVRNLLGKYGNICPITAGSSLMFLATKDHGSQAENFLSQLYSGSNPEAISGMLRERFIKMRMSTATHSTQMFFALLIKAFNSHVNGTKLGNLRLGEDEAFPKITGKVK